MVDRITQSRINGRTGGRPIEGQVRWRVALPNAVDPERRIDRWWARVKFVDGSRRWVELDPALGPDDEEGAKAEAREAHERIQRARLVTARETVREYADRWLAWRKERGIVDVKGDRRWLELHVFPFRGLGDRDIRRVTKADVEDLVEALDRRVSAGDFEPKTAINIFGVASRLFADAASAKRRDLRVRKDNPAAGVAAPERGVKKSRQYLYPSEFVALVTSARVPLRWKRLFALAVYTGLRQGELRALTWPDVNMEHGSIHVHRSFDSQRGHGLKPTKSSAARRPPIEPNVLPLFEALAREAGAEERAGVVVRMPSIGTLSDRLRFYLGRAGVERDELFVTDATRKQITFHDLRATWTSWAAIRGDQPLQIMQRAGHTDFQTTQIYLREAENLRAGFGTVFPPLPSELLGATRPKTTRFPVKARVKDLAAVAAMNASLKTSESTKWAERDSNP